MEIKVNITQPKGRYVLYYEGKELQYLIPSYNRKLEWKTYKSACDFLLENDFLYNGKKLNGVYIVQLEDNGEVLFKKWRKEDG